MSPEQSLKADALIVGGGLVGLIAAHVLANCSLKVIILDHTAWPASDWKPAHSKGLALNHASISFLQSLGISLDPSNEHISCIRNVHVSEKGAFSSLLLNAEQADLPFLGYLIPESTLFSLIKSGIEQHQNIQVIRPASIQTLKKQTDHWDIHLDEEKNIYIQADLLIAADGAESHLRELLQIKAHTNPQQQFALVAQVQHSHPHQETAYQRFSREGTLAFLPENNSGYSTLIISAEEAKINRWKQYPMPVFLSNLQNLFGFHLGKIQAINHLRTYPLQTIIAEEQIRPGFLLLGNAAHFIHPVAAQGLNLSLQDIKRLQEIILTAQMQKQTLTDFSLLQKYDALTKERQKKVIDLTNTIVNFFSSPHLTQSILRRIGLSALQLSPTLKKKFTRFAAGY